ncbi:uncharacterized protein [Aegilops tauschii subsp. strangulata]|nr:uncharacterized protein LOC109756762 [Aegilops tauschii subsp. strangulata]
MKDHREQLLDQQNWDEVTFINDYSSLMGYLYMAIKGLGFLVLTWTTVVLLGGFVSMLHSKDFWCLTFITLVQTAGIFDVVLNEKLRYIVDALIALFGVEFTCMLGDSDPLLVNSTRFVFACIFLFVQILVLTVVLCPLAIIYVFGILMSGGISLWRLIKHDYSNPEARGVAPNLPRALDTLYYLAVLQGVLFCYRFILRLPQNTLVKKVVRDEYKCTNSEVQVVSKYLYETRRGCEKDPSFAKGRNLITVAVDKIGSNSPIDCISGVKMLYTSICIGERKLECLIQDSDDYCKQRDIVSGQHMVMKHLILSTPSSRHVLPKLLETLGLRGIHDREARYQAAMIVERLAFNINLEDFAPGIQHISSLITPLQEYTRAEPYQREYEKHLLLNPSLASGDDATGELGKAYKALLLQGMCILQNLAANGKNCRVISETPDLVSKIMAPLTFDLLHHTTEDHGAWSDVVEGSVKVLGQLTSASGETGTKLRREISSNEGAISTLRRILSCNKCNEELQQRAIWVLTNLYTDTTESNGPKDFILPKKGSSSSVRDDFVRMLVDIFMSINKCSSSVREYAGEVLSEICFHGRSSDAKIVIPATGHANNLTGVLLRDKNKTCKQAAAEILNHLFTHYIKDDEYLGGLKKAILEVIGEILCRGDETHNEKIELAKPETDKEGLLYYGLGKGISSSTSSGPQNNEKNVNGEILLCGYNTRNGNHASDKPESDIESLLDNGQGKRIISSSSSHLQNDEKRVLGKIFSSRGKTHKQEDAEDGSAKQKVGIEGQCDGTKEINEQDKMEERFQAVIKSNMSANLLSSLLSLCGMVYDMMPKSDLAPLLDASSFINKLKEVVVKKCDPPQVSNLLLCKAISKMVISLMAHPCSMLIKPGDLEGLIEALSDASKNMLDLDHSMVFHCASRSFAITPSKVDRYTHVATPSKLDRCTLASLVKKLHDMKL